MTRPYHTVSLGIVRPLYPLPPHWPSLVQNTYLQVVSLIRAAHIDVRAGFDSSLDPRAVLVAENSRLRDELQMSEEENRIHRARSALVPPREQPHYPPHERLAIVLLKARRGWSIAETARRFLVTAATIRSWMHRLDEEGPDALIQTPVPVNRFPDFVADIVRVAGALCPGLGRRKVADMLARAGLHLSAATVDRMRKLQRPPPSWWPWNRKAKTPRTNESANERERRRIVTAKCPHHLWHIDLTTMPMAGGFWVAWFPFFWMRWPFGCWVVVVEDHFSRAELASTCFKTLPSAEDVCRVLDEAVQRAGRPPRHIVSDKGKQFQKRYRAWCKKQGVRPRFGALGKHGSIAVVERLIRTIKTECLRLLVLRPNLVALQAELDLHRLWYNTHRPHSTLGGATPEEVLSGVTPTLQRLFWEPRPRYPLARGDPEKPRPKRAKQLELCVSYLEGRKHLPIFEIRRVA